MKNIDKQYQLNLLSLGKGVTSDPCDTDHLGFCPLDLTMHGHHHQRLEKEDANKEEVSSSWADKIDIPKEKCTFNCLHKVGKKGKLKVCKGYQVKLIVLVVVMRNAKQNQLSNAVINQCA